MENNLLIHWVTRALQPLNSLLGGIYAVWNELVTKNY